MTVVCDTNVLVSALIFPGGKPDKIFRSIISGSFKHSTSPDILSELVRVLAEKLGLHAEKIDAVVSLVRDNSRLVYPDRRLFVVKSDPADNRILECAIAAKANYLITGDKKHILPIKFVRGVRVLSPADFAFKFKIL